MSLTGQKVLITGASSGIGAAIAKRLATENATVILFARSFDKLTTISDEIRSNHPSAQVICASVDVQDYEQLDSAVKKAVQTTGPIDILINNAGLAVGAPKAFHDLEISDITTMTGTNINGYMFAAYAVLNGGGMKERKQGTILNVTSITGLEVPPFPGEAVYHTSKAAQEAFTNALRNELTDTNIKVLALRPGVVATHFHELRVGYDNKQYNEFMDGYEPLVAEDIAEAAVYMLSQKERVSVKAMDVVPTAQRSLPVFDRNWSERNAVQHILQIFAASEIDDRLPLDIMSLLVLSAVDVAKVTDTFTPEYLQDLMKDAFDAYSSGDPLRAYNPKRLSIPTSKHTSLVMPARIASMGTVVKIVSVPSSPNDKGGLPASSLVIDNDTGALKAVINASTLTALRNAGGSLLSARLVGVHSPSSLVTFGAGQQIQAHVDLFLRAYPSIRTCTIVNRGKDRLESLHKQLSAKFPRVAFTSLVTTYDISSPSDTSQTLLQEQLAVASIVICATSSEVALFPSTWIRDYTHVILVGSYKQTMREAEDTLVLRAIPKVPPTSRRGAPTLLVDSRSACLEEAGELADAGVRGEDVLEIGEYAKLHASTDVAETTSPLLGGFTGPITLFKSVGIGLQDVAIACALLDQVEALRANGENVGTVVPAYA